ncbi:hypothetical protein LU293_00040 [Moraxella nasovis]|uniref:hypothetical protein n=1 Tax=Moraxella nasovis TaxID=2904121 RepID=UPI001F619AE2|nr:hypothetical protein [Moraxella nasovis]UNU73343.1 hypothetical protein LU293_00040 [Moraxella nasovis]
MQALTSPFLHARAFKALPFCTGFAPPLFSTPTFPISLSQSHFPNLTFPISLSQSHFPNLTFPTSLAFTASATSPVVV